jgi:hypothetical protein
LHQEFFLCFLKPSIKQITALMKIKILVTLAFALIASQVMAKEAIDPDLKIDLNAKKTDTREPIQQLDFNKLFKDTEKYYNDAKAWKKIKCEPKSGFICTKHECKKRDARHVVILDKKAKTITRCEDKNCESFEAEFEQTGVFFNIQSKGPVGTLIRVLGDYRYKEITTVALDAYIANGECTVVSEL